MLSAALLLLSNSLFLTLRLSVRNCLMEHNMDNS